MLEDSGRVTISDKRFNNGIESDRYVNHLFIRLVAKGIRFYNIDFRYCIFDSAYLRYCTFDSCDFTGCRFVNSNCSGSKFIGCKFDYAAFDKTIIDNDILISGTPRQDNLKLKFIRSLRMNYQQLGDAKSVNKAINMELQATEEHLLKSWKSEQEYYRKKYTGFTRFKLFLEWVNFKVLDIIWGNGESTWKLFRAVFIVLLGITLTDVLSYRNPNQVSDYFSSFVLSPQIFLGVIKPKIYPMAYLTLIFSIRLIMFGFFMSIIIKRLNRR